MNEMKEVRCCCNPENLIGYLPANAPLRLRELNDGTFAFDSNHNEAAIREMAGFVGATANEQAGKKTWKKTWRK